MSTATPSRRPLAARLYGWLLVMLPRKLRESHAAEVADTFLDLYREELSDKGRTGALTLWGRSVGLLFFAAVGARRDERRESRAKTSRPGGSGHGWRGGDFMGAFGQDLKIGVRGILKRPGFALTTILILAAGIGSTTTIFSVVDTVVLREMPYPEAGRLIHFDDGSHTFPNFRAWREMESFETVVAAYDRQVDLTGDGAPERLLTVAVSREFFRVFGAAAHVGRLFDDDDYPGNRSVAVLSYPAWERLWGRDPSILGKTIQLGGSPVEVIGIMSSDFQPPDIETGSRVDVWFALSNGGEAEYDHGYYVLGIAGRLAQGVSLEAAQAEVDAQRTAIAEVVPRQYVRRDGTIRFIPLVPLQEATVRNVSGMLYMLLGAVGLLLLIACANVANLFLARGTARTREIALRGALGASRGRIAAQMFNESVLVALGGGLLGAALAYGGVELLLRFNPGGIPRIDGLAVDERILGFTVLISVMTGVLFGTFPALQATRTDMNDALKDGAAAVTTSRGGRRVRNGLVIAEITLAVVLLTGAGLLFRTFVAMVQVDPGFETEQLVVLPLAPDADRTDDERLSFTQELIGKITALPGTRSVTAGATLPFTYTGRSRCCWRTTVTGDPAFVDEDNPFLSIVHPVTQDYFTTLDAPITIGRDFERADMESGVPVAILNRRTAEALFGTENVVGRTINIGDDVLTVVGINEGLHHWGLSQDVEQAVYVPYGPIGPSFSRLNLAIRTDSDLEALAPALRETVWSIDPTLPISGITTMDDRVSVSLASPRFLSGLLAAFAAVALLLACGGIYGSMLYTVGQRTREIGIRLALGAEGPAVMGLVLRDGIVLSVTGIVLGTMAALSLGRVMESLVWGVEPNDPITLGGVALVLCTTALFASFLPAWKAARTDPMEALRAE